MEDLERSVSRDEIRRAVWSCGDNKSPGPDGFTFEFFKKYWDCIGSDFCEAVEYFFVNSSFSKGCNSSFVALIPKVMDAKFVNDFRPISLIGSVYKVVTKVLANRLAPVIADLISDTQSAFVAGRQILDGPFILDEILHWCKRKNKKAMFFKVDFAKAYDSVRWDYLLEVLEAFGFGRTWCNWIRGTLTSAKASILINGSPSKEYSCHRGLKQGDPLAPYLFILIMESLHLSFNRVVDEGLFKGIQLPGSLSLSHLFYADDAMFIGEWSNENLSGIINILKSFFLASGLQINILKSQLLGVCVPHQVVEQAASLIGCSIMSNKFRYLGVMVGEYSSRIKAWDDVILKLRSRLSKWKVKTLSIGGRLTLLKSVLGASPIYNMSIFKVPTGVLKVMESIRSRFFNGADQSEKKVTWVAWNKVLASKKHGGLGVSSFFALNRALLLKWVWRFVSQDGSLWYKVIRALYGSSVETHSTSLSSNWCSIMREVNKLKGKGFDFWSHCKKRIGNGDDSRFWFDCWIGDVPLRVKFPRLFALDLNKEASVAVKLSAPIDISFRRNARGGIEEHLLADLTSLMDSVTLSNSGDRWVCDLVSDGNFRVKEIRNYIDDLFLPHQAAQTRWIKYIPIKVNIFAWRARQDCLPTRVNLIRRGITIESSLCPVCSVCEEDVCHIFFRCDLAQLVLRRICRWWGLDPHDWSSFQEWQSWILSIQFSSKEQEGSILFGLPGSRQQKFLVLRFFDVKEQQGIDRYRFLSSSICTVHDKCRRLKGVIAPSTTRVTSKSVGYFLESRVVDLIGWSDFQVHDEKSCLVDDGTARELQGIVKLRFFQVIIDDPASGSKMAWMDKQPEEKTNTDCLVKEQEKDIRLGIHQQNGLVNMTSDTLAKYREDSNEAAFAVAAVEKIYAHESLTFNDTVACECSATVARNAVTTVMAITRSLHQSRIHNEKLVQTLLKGHSILSLEGSLSGDCDVEKNGKWSCIYAVGSQEYQMVCTRLDIAFADVGMLNKFDLGLQTDVQVFVDFDYAMGRSITNGVHDTYGGCKGGYLAKGLSIESGFELNIVAGIATGALSKAIPGSRFQH
ncbi:RNA-directed DNA polymerase, eukaryota [Tanacetum coccineum]